MFKKVPKYLSGSYNLDLSELSNLNPKEFLYAFKYLNNIKRLTVHLSKELIQSPYMKKYFNNKSLNLDKL